MNVDQVSGSSGATGGSGAGGATSRSERSDAKTRPERYRSERLPGFTVSVLRWR